MGGLEGDQHVVEEAPPLPRRTLHERQVVGREHRHPQHAEQVAAAHQPLAVDQDTRAPSRPDLGLDEQLAPVGMDHLGPHDRRLVAVTHQGVGRRAAEAVEPGEEGHGLHQVGLALAVVAEHRREARAELDGRGCRSSGTP